MKLSVDLRALCGTSFTLILSISVSSEAVSVAFLSLLNGRLQVLRGQGVSRQSPQGGQVGGMRT